MDVLELALQSWGCKTGAGRGTSGVATGDADQGLLGWACKAGAVAAGLGAGAVGLECLGLDDWCWLGLELGLQGWS